MPSISASNQPATASEGSQGVFIFPASFAQRRLWFLDQLTPGDVSYNVSGAVEIEGKLDTEALKKSLQEIVQRHESLRTLFRDEQGTLQQVIHPDMPLNFESQDLQTLPESERLSIAGQIARQKSQTPFDLQRGPLFRVTLLRLNEGFYWLIVCMHHIISDGWSVGVLVRELADLYNAFIKGLPSPLPELPIQYVDYTAWQQEKLSGESLQAQVEYWKSQLDGIPSGLQIVTDYPRERITSTQGARMQVQIEPEPTRALKLFAHENGVTLYMVLLAGFQTLLYRYSGQEEILVGSPIAGRTQKETQLLIGFFVNTLVLKAKFDSGITFRQLIRQVKETTLEAYAHQELPFEKLVEELSPDRTSGRTPFFQAMFVFQNAPMPELELDSARLRTLELENDTAKFELTLSLGESANLLQGTLEYSTGLFCPVSMTALFHRYTFLLESLVRDPDLPVLQAPLVDEEERCRVAHGWQSKILSNSAGAQETWAELIAAHAREEKVAVAAGESPILYRELNQQAGEIAAQLEAAGLQPGARVAVYVSEVGKLAAAILGILRSGAVAAPIDPEGPAVRTESILKNVEAKWVVTEKKLEAQLQQASLQCIVPRGDVASLGATQVDPRSAKAEDLALLLYQSGASGRPEAAEVPQRGLLPRSFIAEANILPTDFIGIWPWLLREENGILELLHCLAAGATLVPLEEAGTPRRWANTIREQKITMLYARSSEIERLTREFATTLKNVRLIVCTDQCADLARLEENLKAEMLEKVYCTYGVNETCGWCALYPLAQRKKGIVEYLASGTRLELLDPEMNPLPEGIPGEIFVGQEQLALGYYGLPERTKQAFLSDEYSIERGARVYRSGDIGWRTHEGMLQIHERRDRRSWIAGSRVEPAEIEAALKGLEGLQDAAVLAGQNSVSVFLVTDKLPEPDRLQEWLQTKVPRLMLPRVLHRVDSIPRLADGEVDHLKLKTVAKRLQTERNAAAPYAPPETDIQRKLVAILEKTLGLERVGIHDDFFRIGGHSLLATQVVAQISHELAIELPLRRLFEMPTVAQLAEVVTQLSSAGAQAEAIPQIKKIARVPVQSKRIAQ
jgi:non-ribosomal peptide synthetase component F/acyl carrier protein